MNNWDEYAKNDLIFYDDYIGIVLRNRENEILDEALVDSDNYELIRHYRWRLSPGGYIVTHSPQNPNQTIYLHRLIVPTSLEIDHINRDKLDNRRENLRSCSHAENRRNTKIQSNNKSGSAGVSWIKSKQKWLAEIKIDQRKIFLGYYQKLGDATKIRELAEQELFGDFAPTNRRL